MNAILHTRKFGSGQGLRFDLLRGGVLSVLMRTISLVAGLLITVVLARALAPSGYGAYAFAFSLISLLAVPIQLGLPTLAIREVALSAERKDLGRLRGFLRWSHRTILSMALLIGLATVAVVWLSRSKLDENVPATILAAVLLLPIGALSRLREATLQGLKQVVVAQIPELLLLPTLFLICMGIAWLGFPHALQSQHAMLIYVGCASIAFIVGSFFLARRLPEGTTHAAPSTDAVAWRKALLPMALTSGFVVVNGHLSVLVLGLLSSSADAGLFRIAASGAALASFVAASIGAITSPHVATLYNRGEMQRLQSLANRSAWAGLVPALLVLAVFATFGGTLLKAIYGADFEAAKFTLVVLTAAQVVNCATGVVHCLLNMTGHERDTLTGVIIGSVTNLVLSVALVPKFGLNGAAVAAAVAIVAEKVSLSARVRSRLNIRSSVLS